jgi:hypothetical protein
MHKVFISLLVVDVLFFYLLRKPQPHLKSKCGLSLYSLIFLFHFTFWREEEVGFLPSLLSSKLPKYPPTYFQYPPTYSQYPNRNANCAGQVV